jgi:hypothetical protein
VQSPSRDRPNRRGFVRPLATSGVTGAIPAIAWALARPAKPPVGGLGSRSSSAIPLALQSLAVTLSSILSPAATTMGLGRC